MIAMLEDDKVRKVTYYDSPVFTMKLSRQRRVSKQDRIQTFILTTGKPNYAEREFIKLAKKVGEPFPIKKLQLKFWPKKKPR